MNEKWIQCSKRLPEIYSPVLAFVRDGREGFPVTAYIDDFNNWFSDWDDETIDTVVSHWMPLPDAPKEGGNI